MASNYEDPPPSYDEVMSNQKTTSTQPSDQSNQQTLQQLLEQYEAAKQGLGLLKLEACTDALANYYYNNKDCTNALTYCRQLYDTRLQIYGLDCQTEDMAEVMHRIGVCLNEQSGYEEAITWLQRTIETREQAAEPTIGLAKSYHNYGVALLNTGRKEEAIQYYTRSLNIKEKLAPRADTADKAGTMYSLGRLYIDLSNYEKALEYFTQSLNMLKGIHGADSTRIDIADGLHAIAFAHNNMQDFAQAREFDIKALDIYREVHQDKPDHNDIEDTTYNLSLTCEDMQDFTASEVYYREVVCIRKLKYGRKHEEVMEAYRSLIHVLRAQDKESSAREIEKLLH